MVVDTPGPVLGPGPLEGDVVGGHTEEELRRRSLTPSVSGSGSPRCPCGRERLGYLLGLEFDMEGPRNEVLLVRGLFTGSRTGGNESIHSGPVRGTVEDDGIHPSVS